MSVSRYDNAIGRLKIKGSYKIFSKFFKIFAPPVLNGPHKLTSEKIRNFPSEVEQNFNKICKRKSCHRLVKFVMLVFSHVPVRYGLESGL